MRSKARRIAALAVVVLALGAGAAGALPARARPVQASATSLSTLYDAARAWLAMWFEGPRGAHHGSLAVSKAGEGSYIDPNGLVS
ncbi:MAG TPA: hypothetical protein VIH93_10910, partial [Thermoanaerobaculia bacterium]